MGRVSHRASDRVAARCRSRGAFAETAPAMTPHAPLGAAPMSGGGVTWALDRSRARCLARGCAFFAPSRRLDHRAVGPWTAAMLHPGSCARPPDRGRCAKFPAPRCAILAASRQMSRCSEDVEMHLSRCSEDVEMHSILQKRLSILRISRRYATRASRSSCLWVV